MSKSHIKVALVVIRGCDGNTRMLLPMTKHELSVVQRLAAASKRASSFGCEPKMCVFTDEARIQDARENGDLHDPEGVTWAWATDPPATG